MRRTSSRVRAALALLLVAGAACATVARAQDTASARPTARTPRLVVVGFHQPFARNVPVADTVASALQRRIRADTLWVIPRRDVEANLAPEPYESGAPLSARDVIALGRQLRAEFALDVSATPGPTGVRLVGELYWMAGDALPIATFDLTGPTVAAAADALIAQLMMDAEVLGLRRGAPH